MGNMKKLQSIINIVRDVSDFVSSFLYSSDTLMFFSHVVCIIFVSRRLPSQNTIQSRLTGNRQLILGV